MIKINATYNGNKVILNTNCPSCGKKSKDIIVNTKDYKSYINGTNIQDAFPNLSVDDRELLVLGICNECWDKIFSEDED